MQVHTVAAAQYIYQAISVPHSLIFIYFKLNTVSTLTEVCETLNDDLCALSWLSSIQCNFRNP